MRPLTSIGLALLSLLLLTSTAQAATTTTIDTERDGDAVWTVEVRQALESESEVAAFERLAGNVSTSDSTARFEERLSRTVSSAEEETGRDMGFENFSAEAEVEGLSTTWGVIRYALGRRSRWSLLLPDP